MKQTKNGRKYFASKKTFINENEKKQTKNYMIMITLQKMIKIFLKNKNKKQSNQKMRMILQKPYQNLKMLN